MQEALLEQVEAALPEDIPDRLAVAVSGGSDSMALLLLMQAVAKRRAISLHAVTVDHGLRAEAAAEAAQVAAFCAKRRIPHETLVWKGWEGTGNTQDAARRARYSLMAEWAKAQSIPAIALGHTHDDQAETVVMRLARGSGVDGLSAMALRRRSDGVDWLRPLLEVRRAALRQCLMAEGVSWIEDPSNEDTTYERIRVRKALKSLEGLGVSTDALAQVARNMQTAGVALDLQMRSAAQNIARSRASGISIDWPEFQGLPAEISRRMVLAALRWITGADYSPRRRSTEAALCAVAERGSATLDGCRFLLKKDRLWVMREYNAIKDLRVPVGVLWDGRWLLTAKDMPAGSYVAAVGENGLAQCPDWRSAELPRPLLLASPALWVEDDLIAAPFAGRRGKCQVTLKNRGNDVFVPY